MCSHHKHETEALKMQNIGFMVYSEQCKFTKFGVCGTGRSVKQMFMQVNYISLFCILTAPIVTSESSKSKSLSRVTVYRINVCK